MEIKNLKPINGRILVKDDKIKEKTNGGIYIPQNTVQDIRYGTVIKTSNYITKNGIIIEPEVKKGDKIVYRNVSGAGSCWDKDEETYRMLSTVEIMAIIL